MCVRVWESEYIESGGQADAQIPFQHERARTNTHTYLVQSAQSVRNGSFLLMDSPWTHSVLLHLVNIDAAHYDAAQTHKLRPHPLFLCTREMSLREMKMYQTSCAKEFRLGPQGAIMHMQV